MVVQSKSNQARPLVPPPSGLGYERVMETSTISGHQADRIKASRYSHRVWIVMSETQRGKYGGGDGDMLVSNTIELTNAKCGSGTGSPGLRQALGK